MQKLDQASKTKGHLVKRLDKSKEDVEDLKFQVSFFYKSIQRQYLF